MGGKRYGERGAFPQGNAFHQQSGCDFIQFQTTILLRYIRPQKAQFSAFFHELEGKLAIEAIDIAFTGKNFLQGKFFGCLAEFHLHLGKLLRSKCLMVLQALYQKKSACVHDDSPFSD